MWTGAICWALLDHVESEIIEWAEKYALRKTKLLYTKTSIISKHKKYKGKSVVSDTKKGSMGRHRSIAEEIKDRAAQFQECGSDFESKASKQRKKRE